MSWMTKVRSALTGSAPMVVPAIEQLGEKLLPYAGQSRDVANFVSLDDPAVVEFIRGGGRMTAAGVAVNERMAVRNSGIFRAVTLIASSMGMLPLQLFKRVKVTVKNEDGTTRTVDGAEKATEHPIYRILHKRPNKFMTPFEFKTYMVSRALFDGMAYARKTYKINVRVKGGREVSGLIPLDPKKVTARIQGDEMVFDFAGPNGKETIPQSDMFWFRSPLSSDGVNGLTLLDVAAETIGLAQAAERASGKVLANGALVGGVLEHPKALGEPAIERLRTQFEERQSTPENAGKWIVAEDGLKVAQFGSTLKDAQTAEQRKFQIEEIGRFVGAPRPLLFLDETSWGSGIEQLGLFFITYCLLSWFVTIEEAIARSLLSEEEQDQYFAKFNDAALLRGSLESQANFFSKALGSGGSKPWMSQNEVRDKFNINPKDGADGIEPTTQAAAGSKGEGEDGDAGSTGKAGQPAKGSGGNGQEQQQRR